MKKIRVLVNGAKGKMGQATVRAVKEAKDMELVAECDLGDSLREKLLQSRAQVAVDFTEPRSAFSNTKKILKAGVHPVVGTTGCTPEKIRKLQAMAKRKKCGGLIAPNFALGMILLNRFAQEAVQHFPKVEIIELHHDKKVDAPSGSSIRTAQLLSTTRKIPIHSVRLPGLLAHQELLFGGSGQVLTLRHDTLDRTAFMPGVLLAIRKVLHGKELIYGLENLLF